MRFFADIKSFLKNKDFKVLASNFFNLALIQGLDMVLPLLVIPYTTRVLGFEKLGLIAFAGAVVAYFGIFISYGFNLTATKQVSKNRENNYLLKKIYSQVTLSKLFLILISSIIFFVGIIFIPKFSEHKTLFLISFLSIIFTNLVPYWFFQGIQDLKYTTLLTTIFKVLSTAAIFTFVQKEEDYLIIALLPLISNFIIFTIIQIILYKKYKITLIKITKKDIQTQLHDGFYVFLSQVKITFFTNFNTIVIGSVLGDAAVGLFSSAEKIIRMLSLVQVPIVSSLFPYFSKKLHESRQEGFLQINKIAKVGSVIYIVVCLAVFFLARYIAVWVFGSQIDEISTLIRIMVFIPIFVFANNLYGTQFLLNIGKDKRFTANLLFATILNVCMVIPLTYFFKVNGTAVSVLLTEIFVFVIMYYSAIKNKKNIELK